MAFVDARNRSNRAPAIIGVAAIHAALGVAIVTGLAGGVIETITDTKTISIFVPKQLPPPPPIEPIEAPEAGPVKPIVTPQVTMRLNPNPVTTTFDPVPFTPPVTSPIGGTDVYTGPVVDPLPTQIFDAIAPKPRNGGWVSDSDYKSSWIRRGWEGTAGFRLSIGTNGKVESCALTQSTGHAALDEATCTLVAKRARFDPAKNTQGATVSGTFSSAVRWQIPE